MIRRLFAFTALALARFRCPMPAQAGLLPVQVSVLPESGNYRWTYAIVLPSSSQLQAGDYFTIYDFGGMVRTAPRRRSAGPSTLRISELRRAA